MRHCSQSQHRHRAKAEDLLKERGKVLSWLCGIAHNLSIDTVRKQKTSLEARPLVGNPIPAVDTDEAAFDALRRAQVRAAISELPKGQREVIELAYFRGLSRREIAKATGKPLGTINTRARLGLQKLKSSITGEWI